MLCERVNALHVRMWVQHVCVPVCVHANESHLQQNRSELKEWFIMFQDQTINKLLKMCEFQCVNELQTERATRGNIRSRHLKALKPRDHQVTCSSRRTKAKICVPDL